MGTRPLCVISIAFVAGTGAAQWISAEHPVLIFPLVSLVFLVCFIAAIYPCPPLVRRACGIAAFLCLGLLAGLLVRPELPAPASLKPFLNEPDILVMGEVTRPPDYHPDKMLLPVELQRVVTPQNSFPVRGGIVITLRQTDMEPGTWLPGDRLLARLHVKPFRNFGNPGAYDYVGNRANRGFYGRAHISNRGLLLKLAPTGSLLSPFKNLGRSLERFRQSALLWLQNNASFDVAAFYSALLLGYRQQLSAQWRDHLNRAGVTHLLAISGLHLGMVSLAIFWLSSRAIRLCAPSLLQARSDRRIALWIALLCASMYACVGGLALPTWRAAITLLLICWSIHLYRRPDPATFLAAAALLILVLFPNQLRQISFQLSFAAMIGILLFFPRLYRISKHLLPSATDRALHPVHLFKPFLDALLLSAAVTITVAPLIAYHFNGISLAALIANSLLVPLIGFLVLPIGLATLVALPLNETVARLLLKAGAWLVEICQHIIHWFSHLSWSFIWVGIVPLIWVVGFYAFLAVSLSRWNWQKKLTVLVPMILVLLGYTVSRGISAADGRPDQLLTVTAIDVGQGSSTLVRFPNGATMLVDGGGFFDDSFDVGRHVLAPFFRHTGIGRLDYVILSHDHPDHRNGLRFILDHFEVGSFVETGIESRDGDEHLNELRDIVHQRKLRRMLMPEILHFPGNIGECRVNILHPTPDYLQKQWDHNLNNASLVLQITFGKTCVIIPGDIDASVEKLIFEDHSPCQELLLISPHHGSASSNSSFLFDRLQPKHIIFSCGFDNWFGFPARQVLEECRRRNIIIHRTDIGGAINASSNGLQWNITSYLH
ncbi:DNA internalization-related competence protein ComEC/Rec2 [Desulfoferrobacter suflitae]|uniref:DNA internalization-related competence protein ComEC/Rec2 n=1 Tax=Desulfoferrobacter suflitae TaxID=2865782 RepID=UPI002164E413|nr:DNA internalization-related competence protein ComEC/Rec2 [Desulfoferrobacter suflitae]MCK8603495.1 DNA internalization-related competence protein ComEC/Rec2 [Desulfoferrobacter suflitae]